MSDLKEEEEATRLLEKLSFSTIEICNCCGEACLDTPEIYSLSRYTGITVDNPVHASSDQETIYFCSFECLALHVNDLKRQLPDGEEEEEESDEEEEGEKDTEEEEELHDGVEEEEELHVGREKDGVGEKRKR